MTVCSAIAITLLILEISVPAGSEDDLLQALLEQWPSYLAYVVSFATVGAIWLAHTAVTEYLPLRPEALATRSTRQAAPHSPRLGSGADVHGPQHHQLLVAGHSAASVAQVRWTTGSKERPEWWGRVHGPDGHPVWIRAAGLCRARRG